MTASRLDEAAGAKWKDIDFHKRTWQKPVVKSRRVRKRSQTLPLPDQVIDLLKGLPGYAVGDRNALIFPNDAGGQIENLTRFGEILLGLTGVEGWHRHDLRRTASIIMEGLGVSDHTIDRIIAHKTKTSKDISPALASYLVDNDFDFQDVDHQRVALGKLADFLAKIEREAGERAAA